MSPARLKFLLALTVLFIVISQVVYGQTGIISGVVVDKATGDPLPGANIIIAGTHIGAAATLSGEFRIPRAPVGTQTLVVSYIGYKRVEDIEVIVSAGRVTEVTVTLEWMGVTLDEVVISAQARGQVDAINRQLASNTITNIVSADRIRELPDVNAAESIGRLPGVSIHRIGGEANKISIRGLSPKYNVITVNGVRLPSTGADDRSVDLSLISSNMLAGIEVMKAPMADMDADVLGGTVDLRLRESPEDMQVSFSLLGGYNRLQDYYGNYNITGSLSNRFFNNRLGMILNINLDDYDRSADKFAGQYREREDPITGERQIIIREIDLREENLKRGRSGGSVYLDYRIPHGKITLNSFYNQLGWDGLVRTNRYQHRPDERHRFDLVSEDGNTSIYTGAFGFEQDRRWISYDASLSMSATRTNNPDRQQWIFVEEPAPLHEEFIINPGTHPNEVLKNRIINEERTWLQEITLSDIKREENRSAAQANMLFRFFIGDRIDGYIKTGAKFQWLDRMNDETIRGRTAFQYGNSPDPNITLRRLNERFPEWGIDEAVRRYGGLPISVFLDNYARTDFLDGNYSLGFAINPAMMKQMTDYLLQFYSPDADTISAHWREFSMGSLGRDYDGIEKYRAGYIMVEINYGRYFTFIPGIRYEYDYSKYNGQRFREVIVAMQEQPPADYEEVTNERDNEFFLPMLHAIIRPANWLQIRLARTETLTRPDYMHYAPITQMNNWGTYARAANAELKPSHSTNYDAAISVYQNHVGLFTLSGFQKNIKDLIFQTRYYLSWGFIEPLPGMNIPESWYRRSQPQVDTYLNNPYPSTYKGFEIDWQTNFWYLPSPLQGLVFNLNYTRIWSEMEKQQFFMKRVLIQRPNIFGYELIDTTRTTRMPDQAAHIFNATIGYDYKGFSARLSYLFQTERVAYIDVYPEYDHFAGDYARWDFSVRQKVGYGFQIFSNFSNLNNRPDRNFRGTALVQPTYTEYYGFTMDVGLRYNF
jgi:TonB-dependent receptor